MLGIFKVFAPGLPGPKQFSLVCLRRSHRSQYPVFKVRRAGSVRRARNNYTPRAAGVARRSGVYTDTSQLLPVHRCVCGMKPFCSNPMLPDASQIDPTLRQTGSSYGKGAPPGGAPPRQTENARRWSATSCSPTGYPAVPSALGGLTSGFGMGPGVPPLPWSLTNDGHSAVRAVP